MFDGCIGNCLACGICGQFSILGDVSSHHQIYEAREGFGMAADVGTTTVVLALLDLSTGETVARRGFMNPQRAYGPDVISRIQAANEGHLAELHRLIKEGIASGIDALLPSSGIRQISEIAVAGNTAMIYLLLGLPCESLGAFPFKPAYKWESRYDLFGAGATLTPWFGAFVGGDVAAGLLYVLPEGKKRFMLIDLGTNGEMALYNGGKLTVASAAAGPAFESGRGGASGVIRELARLARTGLVDETGLLKESAVFTQKDIRGLQLAKSAVRSGIEILLEDAGLSCGDLDAVYLAGGIGQAMDVEDAADIGLIPPELRGKARAVGNASLGGAARLLLSPSRAEKDLRSLLSDFAEIRLAEHPRFSGLFMDNLRMGK